GPFPDENYVASCMNTDSSGSSLNLLSTMMHSQKVIRWPNKNFDRQDVSGFSGVKAYSMVYRGPEKTL
ncbi:MAG: hypothetical protein KAT62_09600, partial [Desulfuromonadales bacterium]|nr:hypothetical protein [Desulfuromonadales bacterium]